MVVECIRTREDHIRVIEHTLDEGNECVSQLNEFAAEGLRTHGKKSIHGMGKVAYPEMDSPHARHLPHVAVLYIGRRVKNHLPKPPDEYAHMSHT